MALTTTPTISAKDLMGQLQDLAPLLVGILPKEQINTLFAGGSITPSLQAWENLSNFIKQPSASAGSGEQSTLKPKMIFPGKAGGIDLSPDSRFDIIPTKDTPITIEDNQETLPGAGPDSINHLRDQLAKVLSNEDINSSLQQAKQYGGTPFHIDLTSTKHPTQRITEPPYITDLKSIKPPTGQLTEPPYITDLNSIKLPTKASVEPPYITDLNSIKFPTTQVGGTPYSENLNSIKLPTGKLVEPPYITDLKSIKPSTQPVAEPPYITDLNSIKLPTTDWDAWRNLPGVVSDSIKLPTQPFVEPPSITNSKAAKFPVPQLDNTDINIPSINWARNVNPNLDSSDLQVNPNLDLSGFQVNPYLNTNLDLGGVTNTFDLGNVNPAFDMGGFNFDPNMNIDGLDFKFSPNMDLGEFKFDPNLNLGGFNFDPNMNLGEFKFDPNVALGGFNFDPNVNMGGFKFDPNLQLDSVESNFNLNLGNIENWDPFKNFDPLKGLDLSQFDPLKNFNPLQGFYPLLGFQPLGGFDLSGYDPLKNFDPLGGLDFSTFDPLKSFNPLGGLDFSTFDPLKNFKPLEGFDPLGGLDLSTFDPLANFHPLENFSPFGNLSSTLAPSYGAPNFTGMVSEGAFSNLLPKGLFEGFIGEGGLSPASAAAIYPGAAQGGAGGQVFVTPGAFSNLLPKGVFEGLFPAEGLVKDVVGDVSGGTGGQAQINFGETGFLGPQGLLGPKGFEGLIPEKIFQGVLPENMSPQGGSATIAPGAVNLSNFFGTEGLNVLENLGKSPLVNIAEGAFTPVQPTFSERANDVIELGKSLGLLDLKSPDYLDKVGQILNLELGDEIFGSDLPEQPTEEPPGSMITLADILSRGIEEPTKNTVDFQAPYDPYASQIQSGQQELLNVLQGSQEIPFLSDLMAQQDIEQGKEMSDLRASLARRGVRDSTISDEALQRLRTAQRAEDAGLAMQTLQNVVPQYQNIYSTLLDQGKGIRQQALNEFALSQALQQQSDAARSAEQNQALTMLLNALGVSTISPQMPNYSIPGRSEPGFWSSIGNIGGNVASALLTKALLGGI